MSGYVKLSGLRQDQMICSDCGAIAESDSVDVGVGLYVRGNFTCPECGWEYEADGIARVGCYDDWFPDLDWSRL